MLRASYARSGGGGDVPDAWQSRDPESPTARRRGPLSARVAFVRDLAEKITSVADLDQLGDVVLREVQQGLDVSAVVFTLMSEDGEIMTTLVADGISEVSAALLATPILVEKHPAFMAALARGAPLLPCA